MQTVCPALSQHGVDICDAATHRCINPVLTIVAAIAWGKPVFLSHPDRREEANAARKLLAADSAGALPICEATLCLITLEHAWLDQCAVHQQQETEQSGKDAQHLSRM